MNFSKRLRVAATLLQRRWHGLLDAPYELYVVWFAPFWLMIERVLAFTRSTSIGWTASALAAIRRLIGHVQYRAKFCDSEAYTEVI